MLSTTGNIPIILEVVKRGAPHKILDVGSGMGKFGLLLREQYLSDKAAGGELSPVDDIIIDSVEDTIYFHNFRSGVMFKIYDTVYPKSVFDCIPLLEQGKYDIVLLIDVVEHWTKEKTMELIREATKHSNVLVSTPKRPSMYTKHYYGDSRHHITKWTEEDFKEFKTDVHSSKHSHIIFIHKKHV